MSNMDFMNLLAGGTGKDKENYRNNKITKNNIIKLNNTNNDYWSRWQKEMNKRINDSNYELEWQDTGWVYKN